jgi:hypothetical protein
MSPLAFVQTKIHYRTISSRMFSDKQKTNYTPKRVDGFAAIRSNSLTQRHAEVSKTMNH